MPLTVQLFVISLLLWSKLKVAAYQSQESKWLRIKLQTNNLKVSLILTHKHANLLEPLIKPHVHNHGKNKSCISAHWYIVWEKWFTKLSEGCGRNESQASGSGGFELTIVIVGVCAWLSTPASSNPHSAVPCDAVFLCCSCGHTCWYMWYTRIPANIANAIPTEM